MGCHTVYAVCTAHPRLVRVCASYVQFPLSPTHPQRQAALRLRFAYRPVCTACTITQKADGVHMSAQRIIPGPIIHTSIGACGCIRLNRTG